ncbi:MAG: cytochrome P450 [Acidimicrobiales bacterium]|jgi:cytochrome P450
MSADTVSVAYRPDDPGTHGDPYPVYARLRDEDPVHRAPGGFWVLSRFEDVFAATLDPDTYSSAQGLTYQVDEIVRLGLKPTLVMMDRPRHTTFRRLISRGFTPRNVADLEPAVRAFVRERVGVLADGDEMDVIDVLAGPLPTLVVALYLGVPETDRAQFDDWSGAIVAANAGGDILGGAADAVAGLYGYFTELIAHRRDHPGDDMLSDLVAARVDGRPLALDEILGFCFVMIAGGNDTTTGMLGGTLVALCEFPGERARLLADPALLTGALEEFLRLTTPVQGLSRTTTRRVHLHGATMEAGAKVHLLYGSANRDPREFGPDADRLQVTRTFRRMLTFGNGPHHCIGAAAARLQARVALEELLDVLPDFVAHADRGVLAPGPFVRRYASLPFDPGRRRRRPAGPDR